MTYSGFVVNGPGSLDGSGNADQLDLGGNVGLTSNGNFSNLHGGAGEGGRVGLFLPWKPQYDLEVGVSGMTSPWDNASRRRYNALVADWALHVGPSVEVKGEYMNTWVGTDDEGTHHSAWLVGTGGIQIDRPQAERPLPRQTGVSGPL